MVRESGRLERMIDVMSTSYVRIFYCLLFMWMGSWTAVAEPVTGSCEDFLQGETWTRVESEHFRIQGEVDAEVLESLAIDLERLRSILTQLAPSIDRSSEPRVRFQVFAGLAALQRYWPTGIAPGDPGFLLKAEDEALGAVGFENEIRVARQTALRQYLHHLLTSGDRRMPLWLRYGLVELYSTFVVRDGVVELGRFGPQALWRIPRRLSVEALTSRREIGSTSAGGVGDQFIGHSFFLFHYLMVGQPEERRAKLPELVRALLDGADAAEAFHSVYGIELSTLTAQLIAYREQEGFSHLERPAEPWTGAVTPSPMSVTEVRTDLGRLLLYGRSEEPDLAEIHFRCAVQADPSHGPAWRGLGRVAELQEDDGAALSHYRRALELMPDDVLTLGRWGNLLLGSVSGRPGTEEETAQVRDARETFLKILEIEPGRADTWADLGRASLLLRETRQEAVDELTRAAELLPDREDVVSNLLLAHAQLGHRDDVEALYDRLLKMDAEPQTLARAREVRYQLDFQLADAMVKNDRFDDAVALYAQILTGTRNPQLAENAEARLKLLARAERYNQFVELYQEAVQILESSEPTAHAEAVPVVEALEEMARPGLQLRMVRALQEQLEGGAP